MTEDLKCTAAPVPGCAQSKLLAEHAESLDKAHVKLRHQNVDIEHLKMQTGNCLERIEKVERVQAGDQRVLLSLDGRLSNVEGKTEIIESTAIATHKLLAQHVAAGISEAERRSKEDLKKEEVIQKRLVKITGAVTAILVIAALIHSAVTGQSVWTVIGSVLG